jgi:hypothetical protein
VKLCIGWLDTILNVNNGLCLCYVDVHTGKFTSMIYLCP